MPLTKAQQAADDAQMRAEYARRLFTDTITVTLDGAQITVTLDELRKVVKEGGSIALTLNLQR